MRFLGRCLLFGSVLLLGCGSPVSAQPQGSADLCVAIKTQAEARISLIKDLSTAAVNPAASATLPAQLQTCITNDSNTGKVLRVIFQVYKAQGNNYPSEIGTWTAAGWPSGVAIPTQEAYAQFAVIAASLAAGGIPTIGVGSGGNIPNFDPNQIPACVGKSQQECLVLCYSNPLSCAGLSGLSGLFSGMSGLFPPLPGGTGGNIPGLPPFIPPNLNDLLKQYQQALGTIGTCQASCPTNLLCVGTRCVPPQPLCDPPCGPQQFCRPKLDSTAIGQFNANATAGAYAGAGAGGAQAEAQGSITFNGNVQVRPGGVVSGKCVSLTPVCAATQCPAGQVCAPFDGCKPCAACGNLPGVNLDALLAGGFDPSSLTGNATLPPGQNPGQGQQIPPGTIGQIQGGSSQYGQVVFGASASGSAAAGVAVTAVAGGARANADQLLANIRDAALQLAADAQLLANRIQVAANAALEVVLAAQNSQAGASQSLAINGSLVIRGPGAQVDPNNFTPQGLFNFPPSSSGNSVGVGAVVNAAGGVGLTGDLGSLTLSINAIASAAAAVAVPAGQFLRSSGRVLGSAAQVIVQGVLELRNSGFQPAVVVSGSGNVTVAVGRNGNFSCGSLAIQAGGKLDLWSNGSSTYFANLTRCDASALIRIRVDSIASLKANGGSGIAFGYGVLSASVKAGLKCGAQLYDGTGDSITLTNPNAQTGRRLLAAGDGSQITFQDQNAQYTVSSSSSGSSTGGKDKNSVSAVTPATGLVMIIITTIIATIA